MTGRVKGGCTLSRLAPRIKPWQQRYPFLCWKLKPRLTDSRDSLIRCKKSHPPNPPRAANECKESKRGCR
ncbi:hypothetical protein BDD12DRAFT_861294 [Trichophaea hybrida]|nr:hypothetical protein BDD12DRAFT_861294 [Trichophaea hybrida]